MILLIIFVTFLSSVNKEPIATMAEMSSKSACEAQAVKLIDLAEKNASVDGYYISCLSVPTKT